MGDEVPLEVPEKNGERVRLTKQPVEGWAEPFRQSIVQRSEGTEVRVNGCAEGCDIG